RFVVRAAQTIVAIPMFDDHFALRREGLRRLGNRSPAVDRVSHEIGDGRLAGSRVPVEDLEAGRKGIRAHFRPTAVPMQGESGNSPRFGILVAVASRMWPAACCVTVG